MGINKYLKLKICAFNFAIRIAVCLEKELLTACHLFILWLLNCICLSFPFGVFGLDVDLIVSVPEFTYLLCFTPDSV